MNSYNKSSVNNLGLRVWKGAWAGLIVWLVYGIAEFICATLTPLFVKNNLEFAPSQWSLQLLLLVAYCGIGAICGAFAGLLTAFFIPSARPEAQSRLAALLTLSLGFAINLFSAPPVPRAAYPGLLFALIYVLLIVQALRSEMWRSRWSWCLNPWTASFLLLGSQTISKEVLENVTVGIRLVWSGLFLTLVVGVSFWVHRIWPPGESKWAWRREALAALVIGPLAVGLVLIGNRAPTWNLQVPQPLRAAGKPNVVMVVMDTVRADHLSLYGYTRKTSPVLEDLAKEATVYTNAEATGDFTLPTHASMFTSLYASWHGAHYAPPDFPAGRPLADRFETLAEILRRKGYLTLAEVANGAFLDQKMGLLQGFQVYDNRMPVHLNETEHTAYIREGVRRLLSHVISVSAFDLLFRHGWEITQQAGQMLNRAAAQKAPFFLFVNYMDAHTPYLPPAPFDAMFDGKPEDLSLRRYEELLRLVLGDSKPIPEREHRHLLSQYDGGIATVDSEIGKLISRLKALGQYENTLLIITADHGEAFGEKRLIGHQVSVYQNQIHVPLIVKYPHSRQAQVSNGFVSQVDVLPTVLDVLGYELPAYAQGKSLRNEPAAGNRVVISESFPPPFVHGWNVPRLDRTARALMSGSMKYTSDTAGRHELYDLQKDPREERSLYGSENADAVVLQSKLSGFLQLLPRKAGKSSEGPRNGVNMDKLRSLGYVQ